MTLYVSAFNLITGVGILQGGFLGCGCHGVQEITAVVQEITHMVQEILNGVQKILSSVQEIL